MHNNKFEILTNMPQQVISVLQRSINLAHPSWHPHLWAGVQAITIATPEYLPALMKNSFLPTQDRLFAAFSLPIDQVRYVLFGEGPYPREESATGYCFMDGAVDSLWKPGSGLATRVNRATSLRNFIKMLLVTDGMLAENNTGASAIRSIADHICVAGSGWITTRQELQDNFLHNGFLLLNASLVFRPEVPPARDVDAWRPFIQHILTSISGQSSDNPTIILWGKMAEQLKILSEVNKLPCIVSEHPYNLSFIGNVSMQKFFKPFNLLSIIQNSRTPL